MSAHSRNVLYTLRHIIPSAYLNARATYTTLSLAHGSPLPSNTESVASASSSEAHVTVERSVPSEFLEAETSDYRSAHIALPPRQEDLRPIPWPTVFAHHSATRNARIDVRRRRCDTIASLVKGGDLQAARTVYDELHTLNIPVHARMLYLDAARQCLFSSAADTSGFLFWLGLIPNRPATTTHAELKRVWLPILGRALESRPQDLEFLASFTLLVARKGYLPVMGRPLLTHLAILLPPHQSTSLLKEASTIFLEATSSIISSSKSGQVHRRAALLSVDGLWNSHLRALFRAGWNEDALSLLKHPPFQVTWSDHTLDVVANKQQEERRLDEMFSEDVSDPREPHASLGNKIRKTLRTLPRPSELASLIYDLKALSSTHPNFLGTYRRCFIRRRSDMDGHSRTGIRYQVWLHAELISLRLAGRHDAALEYFEQHWLWLGLPDVGVRKLSTSTSQTRKTQPSIYVVTSVLRSILRQVPDRQLLALHQQYLGSAKTLPPVLQPTPATHSVFIHEIAYRLGVREAVTALEAISAAGFEPGVQSYNVALCALASSNMIEGMMALLSSMLQSDGQLGGVPLPTKRTFLGVVAVLEKYGRWEAAAAVKQVQAQYEQETDSSATTPDRLVAVG